MTQTQTEYDVTSSAGLAAFYDDTVDEVFHAAVLLTGTNRAQAEDLVQDAYLRLLRAIGEGRVTRVSIGWIITTLRHRHFDVLRSTGREQRRITAAAGHRPDSASAPDRDATELLTFLTPRERSALVLRYIEDLPVMEVADAMNTTVRAAESLLQRAKAKMRTRRPQ